MKIITQNHPKILTKNAESQYNGWLVPIFNVHDGLIDAAQHPQHPVSFDDYSFTWPEDK